MLIYTPIMPRPAVAFEAVFSSPLQRCVSTAAPIAALLRLPLVTEPGPSATSLLLIPVIGSIARVIQRLNCSVRGSMERALNNSAVECRVLWNQSPELVKDY